MNHLSKSGSTSWTVKRNKLRKKKTRPNVIYSSSSGSTSWTVQRNTCRRKKRPNVIYSSSSESLSKHSVHCLSACPSPVQPLAGAPHQAQLKARCTALSSRTCTQVRSVSFTPVSPPVDPVCPPVQETHCPGQKRQRLEESSTPGPDNKCLKRSRNLLEESEPLQKRNDTGDHSFLPKKPEKTQVKAGPSSSSCGPPAKHTDIARIVELYHVGPLLGQGGFGSVFAGVRKADGLPVAIKCVSKGQAKEELEIPGQGNAPLEVALMVMVNTPPCSSVLQLLEWYDLPSEYVMILERPVPCQDLTDFCKAHSGALPESLARTIMMQVLEALLHCKRCGVLHRDVKPDNLLIQTDMLNVKLIDFGCGDLLKNTAYTYFAGTLDYAPPEWFLQRQYLAEAATVWSLGVTLVKLMCGFMPHNVRRDIISGRLDFNNHVSPECHHLIRWCLSPEAADRPSLEEIKLHPWFQS